MIFDPRKIHEEYMKKKGINLFKEAKPIYTFLQIEKDDKTKCSYFQVILQHQSIRNHRKEFM